MLAAGTEVPPLPMVSPSPSRPESRGTPECPHVDRNDHRCGERFCLSALESMFSLCCGGYHACAVYHRINMELNYGTAREPARRSVRPGAFGASSGAQQLTANGRPIEFRATGT